MPQKKLKVLLERGKWLFIVPIEGLEISKELGHEITINKVTFVCKSKLPYIRKRLGFPDRISTLVKNRLYSSFFKHPKYFAVCSLSGEGKDKEDEFIHLVREELDLLSLSQLGYGRRRHNACLSLAKSKPIGKLNYLMLNTDTRSGMLHDKLVGQYMSLRLNSRWANYHGAGYYFKLLSILKKKELSSSWFDDIKNASLLIGQSQSSNSLTQAFLWNMIALETLLTHGNDKHSRQLPKRARAFIGWSNNWELEEFEEKIQKVYKKRNNIVHSGKVKNLSVDDLLFTDNLLLNILYNITIHIKMFRNKEALISFSEKVEAEHLLGIDSKIRPKTLHFLNIGYTEQDYEQTQYFK